MKPKGNEILYPVVWLVPGYGKNRKRDVGSYPQKRFWPKPGDRFHYKNSK